MSPCVRMCVCACAFRYSEAIDLEASNAVLLNNRAAAYFMLDQFWSAVSALIRESVFYGVAAVALKRGGLQTQGNG
jgi:hypothetical protein